MLLACACVHCKLAMERVKIILDDIKASREWITTIRPVYAWMNRAEASKAMAGEADPATLPEPVIDLLDEAMAEDPTIIHFAVIYDPAWSLDTIAKIEAQMAQEVVQKGVQWENFVQPFMPYWKSYMGPWLCHIQTVSARLMLDCPKSATTKGAPTR